MSADNAKTMDGRPTSLNSLNTGEDVDQQDAVKSSFGSLSVSGKLARVYKNLNLIMAGMYTGVGCAGTPLSEHSYEDDSAGGKNFSQVGINDGEQS